MKYVKGISSIRKQNNKLKWHMEAENFNLKITNNEKIQI